MNILNDIGLGGIIMGYVAGAGGRLLTRDLLIPSFSKPSNSDEPKHKPWVLGGFSDGYNDEKTAQTSAADDETGFLGVVGGAAKAINSVEGLVTNILFNLDWLDALEDLLNPLYGLAGVATYIGVHWAMESVLAGLLAALGVGGLLGVFIS